MDRRVRFALAAALSLALVVVFAGIVLQMMATVTPSRLPFEVSQSTARRLGYAIGGAAAGRRMDLSGFPQEWTVDEVHVSDVGVQPGDRVLAFNDQPLAPDCRVDGWRDSLKASLAGLEEANLLLVGSEPLAVDPAVLVSGRRTILSATDAAGNPLPIEWVSKDTSRVVIDSSGVAIPGAPGQLVSVGLRWCGSRDLSIVRFDYIRPDERRSGGSGGGSGREGSEELAEVVTVLDWRVVEVRAVPYGIVPSIPSLTGSIVAIFVLLAGLLALRARSGDVATPRFVVVCVLWGLLEILGFSWHWLAWRTPLLVGTPMDWLSRQAWLAFVLIPGILCAFLWFLQAFPDTDQVLPRRFRVPAKGLVACTLMFPGAIFVHWLSRSESTLTPLFTLGVGLPLLIAFGAAFAVGMVLVFTVPVRIVWLAVDRVRREKAAEELGQARMVLYTIAIGFTLFIITWLSEFAFAASAGSSAYELQRRPIIAALGAVSALAMGLPFLGVLLAMIRRGLWDVDLIVKRATLYSGLTVVFVLAWLSLDVTIERLVPAGILGLGWLNDLGATALAAGVVAVSQRWVANTVTRRFFPESERLDRVVADISEELGSLAKGSSPAGALGQRLSEALGPTPCIVLVRRNDNLFARDWGSASDPPTALLAGAAVGALEHQASTVVTTDAGPVLVSRIGKSESYPGLLILGPREGGLFYNREERRLLSLLLNHAASLFRS
jgi:hypothetical protein